MEGVYMCQGSDHVQVSPDVPLFFLNDLWCNSCYGFSEKCLWSLRNWETEKKEAKKRALIPEKYLWKKTAKGCKTKDSALQGNMSRNEGYNKDNFIKLKHMVKGIVVKYSTRSTTELNYNFDHSEIATMVLALLIHWNDLINIHKFEKTSGEAQTTRKILVRMRWLINYWTLQQSKELGKCHRIMRNAAV